MTSESDQQREFQRRLQRIEQRSKSQTVFVGEDETYQLPRRNWKVKRGGLFTLLGNAFYPMSMVLAVAVGVLAHAVGMLIRFYIHGLRGWSDKPDIDMLVQLFLGFAIAMTFGYLIGLRSSTHTPLKLAGAALGVLFFHNIVHLYPEEIGLLTSKMWVSQILGTTKAHSLLWMGISFVL